MLLEGQWCCDLGQIFRVRGRILGVDPEPVGCEDIRRIHCGVARIKAWNNWSTYNERKGQTLWVSNSAMKDFRFSTFDFQKKTCLP